MTIMIGTIVDSIDEANKIASECVKKRIAACAHIDKIKSMFFWENEFQEKTEYRVFLKSSDSSYDDISSEIVKHHSYIEPAIFCLPIIKGSDSYLKWVNENSKNNP